MMMMELNGILEQLPYGKAFLFVDELLHADENGITGTYRYDEGLDFYKGHFRDRPVTPGVILTETMAQIGLVCLGIFLMGQEANKNTQIVFTSADMQFLQPVYPGQKVTVTSTKKFFRFGKLKCEVKMKNEEGHNVCSGTVAGMIIGTIWANG